MFFLSSHLQWFRVIGFVYGEFIGRLAKKAEFEVSNLSLRLRYLERKSR